MLTKLFSGLLHKRLIATPSPEFWTGVEQSLPFLGYLATEEKQALRAMALEFLQEKVFTGAAGFEPDAGVRLSIALQACLPILKLGLRSYAGWCGIVVYPGDFIIPYEETDEQGLRHECQDEAIGEAWDGGPVILSWFDDINEYEGSNVVIHEFVHKLDMLNGDTDGCPPLHAGMSKAAWKSTMGAAFADMGKRLDAGENTPLDPYAAEHPGEFFAVCAEAFFIQPKSLHAAYPEVFRQFVAFFRQNPLGPASGM
jgi:Mlc titration factor MtfA (ptsG expression regulator)